MFVMFFFVFFPSIQPGFFNSASVKKKQKTSTQNTNSAAAIKRPAGQEHAKSVH
jgi:hypothetical protein